MKYYIYKMLRVTFFMGLFVTSLAVAAIAIIYQQANSELSPMEQNLKDLRLQEPLQVYTKDEKLIAEFGEQRRLPLKFKEIPDMMVKAVLAAEDDRFYEHSGVDLKSLIRAAVNLIKTGRKEQGGSTITMQVARNFFLGREQTYSRKYNEIILALKIEKRFSKDEILELYLNKIFFGHRAYGIGAAAYVYYGKKVKELDVDEMATLAGIPKAPSTNNPISNPERALERRDYILSRMRDFKSITSEQYEKLKSKPLTIKPHLASTIEVEAPYIAEMVRLALQEDPKFKELKDEIYTGGYKVYTTVESHLQLAAQTALRNALIKYDERRGYRVKSKKHVELSEGMTFGHADKILRDYPVVGGLIPSLVVEVKEKSLVAYNRIVADKFEIAWKNLQWAVPRGSKKISSVFKPGDIIMVRKITQLPKGDKNEDKEDKDEEEKVTAAKGWRLSQVPEIEGGLVSLDPNDGHIISLVGGFDFYQSKFNRIIQAYRQPGSNFKPFIYSAAMERGFSPNTTVSDGPFVFTLGSTVWKPDNYGKKFYGPTSLRKALAFSRNLVSIRLLNSIGVKTAVKHLIQFGFKPENIPRNLTLVLGTGEVTPMELARGFAVFANGGFLVNHYFIERILDAKDNEVFKETPLTFCTKGDFTEAIKAAEMKAEEEAKRAEAEKMAAAEAEKLATEDGAVATKDSQDKAKEAEAEKKDKKGPHLCTEEDLSKQKEEEEAAKKEEKEQEKLLETSIQAPGSATKLEPIKSMENPPKCAFHVVSVRNTQLMTSMMKDVIRFGTAKKALKMNRPDIAGKTGTTNDHKDAWFSGYTPDIVTTTWMGFDHPRSLGEKETGGKLALPMWMDFMQVALKGKEPKEPPEPKEVLTVRLNPQDGLPLPLKAKLKKKELGCILPSPPPVLPPPLKQHLTSIISSPPKPTVPKRADPGSNGMIPEQLY